MSAQTASGTPRHARRTTSQHRGAFSTTRAIPLLAWLALAACWLLLAVDFSRRSVWSAHEGRAAQHAQVMLDTGEWGLPRLFWGEPDLQKPPLYYWLVAGTAALRGGQVDELAVRLPSLVAAMLLVLLVYGLGTAWWGRSIGLLAAVSLTTMPRFWWLARVGRIDMPLACCVAVAMACFWVSVHRSNPARPHRLIGRRGWFVIGYGALAAGVLLKGPVALLLPAVAISGYAVVYRRLPALPWRACAAVVWRRALAWARRVRIWWGVVFLVAVAAPWFVWADIRTGGALWHRFFVYHNFQRALGGAEALEGRPVWYYVGPLLLDTFPWSLFAAIAIGQAVFGLGKNRQSTSRPVLFCGSWMIAMLLLLSLVRFKRQDYLLPIYPAMALLAAHFLVGLARQTVAGPAYRLARFALFATATASLAAASALLVGMIHPRPEQLSDYLPAGQSSYVLGSVVSRLRFSPFAAHGAIAVAVASAAACVLFTVRRRPAAAACALALVMAVAEAGVTQVVLPELDLLYDQRPFARKIREMTPPGHTIVFHRMECHDLVFYAGRPTRVVVPTKGLRTVLEDAEPVYVVLRRRCADCCEGKCIGGCLRRRREEWPDLDLTLLATNRGTGDGQEQLALVTNHATPNVAQHTPLLTSHASKRR